MSSAMFSARAAGDETAISFARTGRSAGSFNLDVQTWLPQAYERGRAESSRYRGAPMPQRRSFPNPGGDEQREEEIARLIETVARPVAEKVMRRYVRSDSAVTAEDAEDITATVMMRLVARL